MSDDLSKAVADANLPLQVEPVNWSHGAGRIFSDRPTIGFAAII